MFCMMSLDLVRRIIQNEKVDHTQNRIDLILSSLKFKENSKTTFGRPGIAELLNEDLITEDELLTHIQLPTSTDNYFEYRPQD